MINKVDKLITNLDTNRLYCNNTKKIISFQNNRPFCLFFDNSKPLTVKQTTNCAKCEIAKNYFSKVLKQ